MGKFKIISTLLLLGISVLVGAISGREDMPSYSYGNAIEAASVAENKSFVIEDSKSLYVVSLDEVMEENKDKTFELKTGMRLQAGEITLTVESAENGEKAVCVKASEGKLVLFDGGKAVIEITAPKDMEFDDMFILGDNLEETIISFNGKSVK